MTALPSGIQHENAFGVFIKKPKPHPSGTRFQRQQVDGMWQGDTFHFRTRGVGKVSITRFTDDCSLPLQILAPLLAGFPVGFFPSGRVRNGEVSGLITAIPGIGILP